MNKVKTFVTIGSGQGIDAIGAYHIFHPENILITDIHSAVVPIAKKNVLKNISTNGVSFKALVGNLCEPLIKKNIKADIIYANLPNIPLEESNSVFTGQLTSTFFDLNTIQKCSRDLEKYLLGLQNTFLHGASQSLVSGGSVVVNLGGRVPIKIVKKMFCYADFEYQELFNFFKIQTQPEWVLGGYARAEKKYGITFDFYRYDLACKNLGKKIENVGISAIILKKLLKPYRVNATDALKLFVYKHENIGHVVQLIRGVKY